jgi:hypothetical protein
LNEPKIDWEVLLPFERLQRFKVPGGWIYRTTIRDAVALCFVPEPAEIPVIKVKEAPPTP